MGKEILMDCASKVEGLTRRGAEMDYKQNELQLRMNMILNMQKTLTKKLGVQGSIDDHIVRAMSPHGKNDNQNPSDDILHFAH
jgi:hypothetical protein